MLACLYDRKLTVAVLLKETEVFPGCMHHDGAVWGAQDLRAPEAVKQGLTSCRKQTLYVKQLSILT